MKKLQALALLTASCILAACGGGGGSQPLPSMPTGTPTPVPTATLPPTSSQSVTMGGTQSTANLPEISSGIAGSVTLPAASSGSAQASLTLESALPGGAPAPAARKVHGLKRPANLNGSVTPLAYIALSLSAPVTISSSPAFSLTFPAGMLNGYAYIAFYDPTQPTAGWNAIMGPVSASGTTLNFPAVTITPPATLAANVTYLFAIVETGTPLPTPSPTSTSAPTPIPGSTSTPVPGNGLALTGPSNGPFGTWGPPGVANALAFPVQSGFDGTGQTIAVVIDSDVSRSDLSSFFSYFQIPQTARTITTESVDGATIGTLVPGSQDEATLDVETTASLAPGANIIIYQIPGLDDQSITDAYSQILSEGKAHVVNSSFGGCEFAGAPEAAVIQSGAANGVAFIASSGDQGNECYTGGSPQYAVGANYPASDPNAISVGGTETEPSTYSLSSTTVWNDTSCGSGVQCAGGGGISSLFALPSYQQGLAGVTSSAKRNVPDLSMPAEFTAMYETGNWYAMNGTSWSAPEYAAMMAEIYEYCNTPLSNPVSVAYAVHNANAGAFADVVSGNDQYVGTSPFYTAGVGYDNASGLGVPDGSKMMQTACPNRVPASAMRRSTQSLIASHTQAFALDVTPRVRGLIDEGERAESAPTRVQIVLNPQSGLANSEAHVIAALQQAGFTIVRTFGSHTVVDAQASSASVERFFGTSLHDVTQGGYGTRYLPTAQVVIPTLIAPYVATVNLDNVVTRRIPHARR